MTDKDTVDVPNSIEALKSIVDFAYKKGFHELGWDPIKTLVEENESWRQKFIASCERCREMKNQRNAAEARVKALAEENERLLADRQAVGSRDELLDALEAAEARAIAAENAMESKAEAMRDDQKIALLNAARLLDYMAGEGAGMTPPGEDTLWADDACIAIMRAFGFEDAETFGDGVCAALSAQHAGDG